MLRNIVIKLILSYFWRGNETSHLLIQSFLFLLVMHYWKYSASIFVLDQYLSTRNSRYSFSCHTFCKRVSQCERNDNLTRNYYSILGSWNYYLLTWKNIRGISILINLFQMHGNMQLNFHQIHIKWNTIFIFDVTGTVLKSQRAI